MAGFVAKYIDDVAGLFKGADDAVKYRRVLGEMSAELAEVITREGDPQAVDRFIRSAVDSGDETKATLFRMPEVQNFLKLNRNRALFKADFDRALRSEGPVDLEALRVKHGLDAREGDVAAARVIIEQRGLASRVARGEQDAASMNAWNFVGRYNRAVNRAIQSTPGPLKPAVWLAGKVPLYGVMLAGAGGTLLAAGGIAHLATDGDSTRALTRMTESALTSMYHGLKDIAPGLAEYIKQKSPEMTRFAFTALTLNTNMIKTSLEELDRTHNLGIGANSGALASVIEGNIVMAAFQKVTGVEVGAADVERIMRGAMNEPDKKAYIAREFSRLSGKAQTEFEQALASPELVDVSGLTPEQIQERFGQTSTFTPGSSSPSTATPAGAAAATPTLMDRARTALHRRTEQVRGAAQNTVEQAAETVRIGRLSGSALNEEFNRVAESKNLNWFSSPQMFFIKLMDSIGFDFFGLNNMLKKQVLLDNVKTQFGDQFGFSRQHSPSLNLDPAPAPGS